MQGFPVRVDGVAQVALFAYDNQTFIVESYLPTETDARISVLGNGVKLKNIITGETLTAQSSSAPQRGRNRPNNPAEERVSFTAHLRPHSYAVFYRGKIISRNSSRRE
jgi:hypothetical protein